MLRVVSPAPAGALVLDVVNSGFVGRLAHADVPATLPGVLAGDVRRAAPPSRSRRSGSTAAARASDAAVEALPQLGGKGVLVDFETLARLGGSLPDGATVSVWLADDSQALADEVAKGLATAGIGVLKPAHRRGGQGAVRRVRRGLGPAARRVHRRDGGPARGARAHRH